MRFVEPEPDSSPDWGGGEEEEAEDPEWAAGFPERPPPVTAFPRLWSLPLMRENRGTSLYDLVTEYVYRKFVVLADLTEWSSASPQGITTPNVWTQLKAIDDILASLGLPNVGWEPLYLLLCTLPAEWVVSMELSAGALQEVATSR